MLLTRNKNVTEGEEMKWGNACEAYIEIFEFISIILLQSIFVLSLMRHCSLRSPGSYVFVLLTLHATKKKNVGSRYKKIHKYKLLRAYYVTICNTITIKRLILVLPKNAPYGEESK